MLGFSLFEARLKREENLWRRIERSDCLHCFWLVVRPFLGFRARVECELLIWIKVMSYCFEWRQNWKGKGDERVLVSSARRFLMMKVGFDWLFNQVDNVFQLIWRTWIVMESNSDVVNENRLMILSYWLLKLENHSFEWGRDCCRDSNLGFVLVNY
jgi:hypothetical protein